MSHLGGNVSKQTHVTTYTTDVDPRTLPDYTDIDYDYVPEAAYERKAQHTTPSVDGSTRSDTIDGHRLRRKYTTTTVTTITTTTILLPKMQEALVYPSTTTHQVGYDSPGNPAAFPTSTKQPEIQNRNGSGNGYVQPYAGGGSGSGVVDVAPSEPVLQPDGTYVQPWVFNQQNQNAVSKTNGEHLPTLEELGITSYFSNSQKQQQPRPVRPAPYTRPSNVREGSSSSQSQQQQQQPWISSEVRDEIEGGNNYYRR